jgi:hypothetical protein
MKGRLPLFMFCLCVASMLAVPGVSIAATTENGGFETGSFIGWTVFNQDGSFGNWYVYSGTASPENGFTIAAPPEGTYAATTDQIGPGSHILYQDVALEAGFHHTLSFVVYYDNQAGEFATPSSLDFTVFPNQQYRVDVLNPSAPVTSVVPGEVLATVFQTKVGDPPILAPTPVTVDLSNFAGTIVRVRFAEVDNLFFFAASVDNVALTSTPAFPTTTEQCKKGGWQDFGLLFKNQGDCVSFVATGGKNEPGKNLPY